MRRWLQYLVCLLASGPLVPIYMLRQSLQGCIDLIDWAVEGRAWIQPFINFSNRLERRFGIDAESQHEAWRTRMGFEKRPYPPDRQERA